MSDIDTVVVDSLKALDPEWPIREADIARRRWHGRKVADNGHWLPGGHGATRFVTPLNCVMTEPLMSFRGVLPMCSLLVRALFLDILSG